MIRLGLFAILFLLEALDRQELFFRYSLEQQLFLSPAELQRYYTNNKKTKLKVIGNWRGQATD